MSPARTTESLFWFSFPNWGDVTLSHKMYPECECTQLQCESEMNTERKEGSGNTRACISQEDTNAVISNPSDKKGMKSQSPKARLGMLLAMPPHLHPHHHPQKSSMEEVIEKELAGVSLVPADSCTCWIWKLWPYSNTTVLVQPWKGMALSR